MERDSQSEVDLELLRYTLSLQIEERVSRHEAIMAEVFEIWNKNKIRPILRCEYDTPEH